MGDSDVRQRAVRSQHADRLAFDLVASKLRRPVVRPGTVGRLPLIERLARGDPRPIVSVVAPRPRSGTRSRPRWRNRSGGCSPWAGCQGNPPESGRLQPTRDGKDLTGNVRGTAPYELPMPDPPFAGSPGKTIGDSKAAPHVRWVATYCGARPTATAPRGHATAGLLDIRRRRVLVRRRCSGPVASQPHRPLRTKTSLLSRNPDTPCRLVLVNLPWVSAGMTLPLGTDHAGHADDTVTRLAACSVNRKHLGGAVCDAGSAVGSDARSPRQPGPWPGLAPGSSAAVASPAGRPAAQQPPADHCDGDPEDQPRNQHQPVGGSQAWPPSPVLGDPARSRQGSAAERTAREATVNTA
jgi:hypothetical protein